MKRLLLLGTAVLTAAFPSSGNAQQDAPSAARWAPPPDALSLPGVESADIPPHLSWNVAGSMATSHNLLLKIREEPPRRRIGEVGWRLEGHTGAAFSFWDSAVVGFTMPGAVQVGTNGGLAPDINSWGTLWPLGPMDARGQARLRLLRQDRHFISVAVALAVTAPTSLGLGHLGEPWPTAQPYVLAQRDFLGARFMVNSGFHFRGVQLLSGQVFADEAFVKVGASYDVARLLPMVKLEPYAQANLALNLHPPRTVNAALNGLRTGQAASDAGVGVRLNAIPHVQMFGGLDLGVLPSPGIPAWRALAGIRLVRTGGDRDGDGLSDPDDHCPNAAEDRDGYSDLDGCPDPDNDQDGMPDVADRCPMWAEDLDGFQDEDGCPEPDNDLDGVKDPMDACPLDPGRPDANGCPMSDADGDGLSDAADVCPHQAEDVDGVQDEDGCVDEDNDGDGIPDVSDACPAEPEDVDGFEDADGCAEPDNDHDGIPDAQDACPMVSGGSMADGCP